MHRALTARLLNRALRIGETSPLGLPVYLCPAIGFSASLSRSHLVVPGVSSRASTSQRRANHVDAAPAKTPVTTDGGIEATEATEGTGSPAISQSTRKLPLTCSGCGAFTQTDDTELFGYIDPESKRVRKWIHPREAKSQTIEVVGDDLVGDVLKNMDKSKLEELGLDPAWMISGQESQGAVIPTPTPAPAPDKPPVCDRCHNLVHYSTTSKTAKLTMYHPTVDSLRETIEESPYKYNHIYHIIDAADFPMSLVPRLNVLLGDITMRSKNRRSRLAKYQKDRKMEISFIITRSDLLGPTKEVVDSMMPYLMDVLRDALGKLGERVRLGNVKCVSAKRAWWTNAVKEDIWKRGGAGWMVGKVNVGKSQLFEAVYPKGRMNGVRSHESYAKPTSDATVTGSSETQSHAETTGDDYEIGDLLPPAQPETNYPEMPLVSSLPGTTASPIRVPFGSGKGELIDLPGLSRGDLELFVKEEHRQSLIMKKRIVPEQVSLKQGKSLLLGGGLIRITPRTPNTVFLMYNFTPLDEHLTMDEKAVAFQDQTRQSVGVENISLPGIGDKMKHAGTFQLRHDVTKKRAGPLTRKNAVGLQVDRLPFRVLSLDILIEGVGYVEIVAQVRARDVERWSRGETRGEMEIEEAAQAEPETDKEWNDPFADLISKRKGNVGTTSSSSQAPSVPVRDDFESDWPAVDIYTPEGRFVGSRQPINGWLNNKPRVLAEHKRSRPRRSMKGQKKMAKQERRAG